MQYPSKYFYSLLIVLLTGTSYLSAQTTIYPVKIDHKWGYINGRGKIVVPPTFDRIAENNLPWYHSSSDIRRSPFRLVEIDNKVGLINTQKEWVLSASYQVIHPISLNHFLVQIDSQLVLINEKEELILDEAHDDVRFMGFTPNKKNAFFSAQKEGSYGVFDSNGQQVLPFQYSEVSLLENSNGFFKVKKTEQSLYSLVDSKNKQILPPAFENMYCYHPNFFMVEGPDQLWEAWDSLGQRLLNPEWKDFKYLNKHLLKLEDVENRLFIYRFKSKDTIGLAGLYTNVLPLTKDFALSRNTGRLGILDSLGQAVLTPTYFAIETRSDHYFKVQSSYLWGLYEVGTGLVLPVLYNSIGAFEDGYAVVRRPEGFGLINESFREVIPCIYSEIKREDAIFKAFSGSTVSVIELDENDQVTRLDDYVNVRSINIRNYNDGNFQDAIPLKRKKRTENELYFYEMHGSPRALEDSPYQWYVDRKTKKWGLKGKATNQPIFRSVKHIKKAKLSMVYSYENPLVNQFSQASVTPADTLYNMALFSHKEGKFITASKFLGVRRHDLERNLPYAAMVDLDGQFGLIKKTGEQALGKDGNPLRFSYIGEFIEGRAKVCLGGQLKAMKDPNQRKYTVEEREFLILKYSLIYPPARGKTKQARLLVEANPGETLKWGFIDTLGNIVVEPKYDFARDFLSGQAVVVKDNNWGVIDQNDKIIIPFEYGSISNYYNYWKINKRVSETIYFNRKGWEIANLDYQDRGRFIEGYCRIKDNGKWGFINEKGRIVVPCQYDQAHDFSEGVAAVQQEENWLFIDTAGQVVIDLQANGLEVDTISDFHDGLCWFKQGYRYGYIDQKGIIQIPANFVKAFDFQVGVARVVDNRKTGLIDTSGKYLLEPKQFERIYPFNEFGVAMVMESFKSKKKGLINNKGQVLSPAKYKSIDRFEQGHSVVSVDGKQFGLINRKGEEVIPLEYEVIGTYSEGYISAKRLRRHNWQYLDTLGKVAFEGQFESAYPFSGGYAKVQEKDYDPLTKKYIDYKGNPLALPIKDLLFFREGIAGIFDYRPLSNDNNYYYADQKGKNLFGLYFQEIEAFQGSTAMVKQNWRNGFINRRGLMIIKPKYIGLQVLDEGLIMARPPAFGVANRSGKILIEPIYDKIELMTGNIYRLERGEKIGYITESGRWIWELQN